MNIIKRWIFKRDIKKIQEKTKMDKALDEIFAEELKNMASVNRTAERMQKIRIARKESKKTLRDIEEMADEDDDNDEEEEEDNKNNNNVEDLLVKTIFSRLIGTKMGEGAVSSPLPNPQTSSVADYEKMARECGISQEQINKIKENYGF